jgi:hypothetical protein
VRGGVLSVKGKEVELVEVQYCGFFAGVSTKGA